MRFLILILLFVLISGASLAEEVQCTLENSQFCGVWDGAGKGGGDMTIYGHRIEWDNGTYYECDIIDEEVRDKRPQYSILRCARHYNSTYYKDKLPPVSFFRLSMFRTDYEEIAINGFVFSKAVSYERIYIDMSDHLACLFSEWKDHSIKEASDFYQCGSITIGKYPREVKPFSK